MGLLYLSFTLLLILSFVSEKVCLSLKQIAISERFIFESKPYKGQILTVPTNVPFYYYLLHSLIAPTCFGLTVIIMELKKYYSNLQQ